MRTPTFKAIRTLTALAVLVAAIALVGVILERRNDRVDATTYGPDRVADASELSERCASAFEPVSDLVRSRPSAGTVTPAEDDLILGLFEVCSAPEMYFIQHDVVIPWRRGPLNEQQ